MYLIVGLFGFIFFEILCTSWTRMSISFHHVIGVFSHFIFFQIHFLSLSLSLLFLDFMIGTLICLRSIKLSSVFLAGIIFYLYFLIFCFCCSDWMIFTTLYFDLLTCSSVSAILLLISSRGFLLQLLYSSVPIGSVFHIFYLFIDIITEFIHSSSFF